jgi:hypothetical protein
VSFFCTIMLWLAAANILWCAARPICRRLNLTAAADRAVVGLLLGFFGLVAALSAVAATA